MLKINLKKCSRCHAPFTDMIAAVKLDLEVFRLSISGVPEQIANLDQEAHEYLCKDCFDDFANVLEQMNLTADEKEKLMTQKEVETVDEDDRVEDDCEYDE